MKRQHARALQGFGADGAAVAVWVISLSVIPVDTEGTALELVVLGLLIALTASACLLFTGAMVRQPGLQLVVSLAAGILASWHPGILASWQ
jgi:hypothetical protein